ncbi:MAG TPA: sulfatase-like hydrolase/transferase, partial [Phycisphaerae bacterium]|nr:sulfatase-like hydrolase/transferase [Phycisphaerae bacterium]
MAPRGKPNVLWIQTDELRADGLGCYGQSPWAHPLTPSLDALAARGVLFDNTYCNSPVCVPSRTSMLTGRYPHEIGVYHNEASRHVLPGELISFPQAFAAAGYQTVTIGKTHTPKHPIWGRVVGSLAGAGSAVRPYRSRGGEPPPLAVRLPGAPPVLVGGICALAPGEISATTHLTNLALEWLQADGGRGDPWMLRVSYLMPHTPVLAPQRFADLFDPADFAFDAGRDRPHETMPAFERFIADANRGGQLSPEQVA